MISREGSDKKKAHADISIKLGKKKFMSMSNIEYLFLANRNWPIFKMAVLNPRWPPQKKRQIRKRRFYMVQSN